MTCSSRYGEWRGQRAVATSTPHLGTDRAPRAVWRRSMRSPAGPIATSAVWLPVPDSLDPEGSSCRRRPEGPRARAGGPWTYDPVTPRSRTRGPPTRGAVPSPRVRWLRRSPSSRPAAASFGLRCHVGCCSPPPRRELTRPGQGRVATQVQPSPVSPDRPRPRTGYPPDTSDGRLPSSTRAMPDARCAERVDGSLVSLRGTAREIDGGTGTVPQRDEHGRVPLTSQEIGR